MEALHDIACGKDSAPWNRETVKDANSLLAAIKSSLCSGIDDCSYVLTYIWYIQEGTERGDRRLAQNLVCIGYGHD